MGLQEKLGSPYLLWTLAQTWKSRAFKPTVLYGYIFEGGETIRKNSISAFRITSRPIRREKSLLGTIAVIFVIQELNTIDGIVIGTHGMMYIGVI